MKKMKMAVFHQSVDENVRKPSEKIQTITVKSIKARN